MPVPSNAVQCWRAACPAAVVVLMLGVSAFSALGDAAEATDDPSSAAGDCSLTVLVREGPASGAIEVSTDDVDTARGPTRTAVLMTVTTVPISPASSAHFVGDDSERCELAQTGIGASSIGWLAVVLLCLGVALAAGLVVRRRTNAGRQDAELNPDGG